MGVVGKIRKLARDPEAFILDSPLLRKALLARTELAGALAAPPAILAAQTRFVDLDRILDLPRSRSRPLASFNVEPRHRAHLAVFLAHRARGRCEHLVLTGADGATLDLPAQSLIALDAFLERQRELRLQLMSGAKPLKVVRIRFEKRRARPTVRRPYATRRIIFHVGAHKTGTSLVQGFAADCAKHLADAGIRSIDRSFCEKVIGTQDQIVAHPEKLRLRIDLACRMQNARAVFVSHEPTLGFAFNRSYRGLYPLARPHLESLAKCLDGLDVQIVLSLRPQADFLESLYVQRVQQGFAKPFAKWLQYVDLQALSWLPIIEHARAVFGPERVTLIDFRAIKAGQNAFLRSFFLSIDPSFDLEPRYDSTRNRSLSAQGLALALELNPHLRTEQEQKTIRSVLQRSYSNATGSRPILLTPEQRAAIEGRYSQEYASIFDRAHLSASSAAHGADPGDCAAR